MLKAIWEVQDEERRLTRKYLDRKRMKMEKDNFRHRYEGRIVSRRGGERSRFDRDGRRLADRGRF